MDTPSGVKGSIPACIKFLCRFQVKYHTMVYIMTHLKRWKRLCANKLRLNISHLLDAPSIAAINKTQRPKMITLTGFMFLLTSAFLGFPENAR